MTTLKGRVIGLLILLAQVAICDTPSTRNVKGTASAAEMPSAERDYREAVRLLGGNEDPENLQAAIRLYMSSGEAGYAPAQYSLGFLYEKGVGVKRDAKLAAHWYQKAAEQDLAEAENNLGSCYAKGFGVRKSSRQAAAWFAKAAKHGDIEAQANLADAYFNGRGVARSLERAFELYRNAAEGGNAVAQLKLAVMYAHGEGAKRDFVQSYVWLEVAGQNIKGIDPIKDKVAESLTSEELTQARRLAELKLEDLRSVESR